MLLSRVKAYNLRFRSKRFMGDPAFTYASTYAEAWEKVGDEAQDKSADPRRTSGFIEIDHIASMFRQSFPLYLRNPIRDGSVDSHLYTACLTPHLCVSYCPCYDALIVMCFSAIILLHDPHAHVQSPGCVSAFKILEASRAVLDLIYAVRSTSFDVTLLDFFCAVRRPTSTSPLCITDFILYLGSFVGLWLVECWCAFGRPHNKQIQKSKP
jgi:hypothetical protein